MASCLLRRTLVGTVLLLSLAWSRSAFAQCSSSYSGADQGHQGYLALQAATTQQNCSGRTTRVASWIQNHTSDCDPETFDSQGKCLTTSEGGNAVVYISAIGCGAYYGRSDHAYIEGGVQTDIQLAYATPLYAGQCGAPPNEDCQATYGLDYWWDGYECTNQASPIIIAIGRRASYTLTSPGEGVLFDLDADGVREQVAWTRAGEDIAFLAIDRDGDGQITSGRELFGNHTIPGALNGFDALAQMAMQTNGGIRRGSVSSDDPLFGQLLLWTDRNHNGVSESDELIAVRDILSDIGLGYDVSGRTDRFGNRYKFKGWVELRTAPGRNMSRSPEESEERVRPTWDVLLSKQQ